MTTHESLNTLVFNVKYPRFYHLCRVTCISLNSLIFIN